MGATLVLQMLVPLDLSNAVSTGSNNRENGVLRRQNETDAWKL